MSDNTLYRYQTNNIPSNTLYSALLVPAESGQHPIHYHHIRKNQFIFVIPLGQYIKHPFIISISHTNHFLILLDFRFFALTTCYKHYGFCMLKLERYNSRIPTCIVVSFVWDLCDLYQDKSQTHIIDDFKSMTLELVCS